MIVTCREMAGAEERLFATGIEAEPLMDKAGWGCARAIARFFPRPGHATVYCGKGNNGGDALVAGRWLRKWGWRVEVNLSHPPESMSSLARIKLEALRNEPGHSPDRSDSRVLIDGLLGIGARGPLSGPLRQSADEMNRIRLSEGATTFAVDIPSGLDGDSGEPYEGSVVADVTLSICAPKSGIVADRAIDHVGRIAEIPLPEIPARGDESIRLCFPSNLYPRLPRRPFDFHKGKAGRIGIVAGSRGFSGAPVLSALGASHSGAGLVSLFVPVEIYPIVAARAPCEAMVHPLEGPDSLAAIPLDVIAVGPGLGSRPAPWLVDLIRDDTRALVIDADGLNALAREGAAGEIAGRFGGPRLLTPHPGELARLTRRTGERTAVTRALAESWQSTLLHKGARTVIATPGHPVELNTTGHPGMASGGMGDVLTGACAALIAQGLSLHDAACVGSWLTGRAAELAVQEKRSAPVSLTAVEMADSLGSALEALAVESALGN